MAFADIQMWLTFAAIGFAIVSFSLDRVPVELTALATLLFLVMIFAVIPGMTGMESPLGFADLLSGFSNPALVAVLSLIIVGQALFQTGALDRPTRRLARSTRLPPWATSAIVLVAAGLLSAFLNNTPVVIMLVPILIGFARERRMAASSLLLPMNFATILGGSLTLIGSSTNLLVADVAGRTAGLKLGFFDITIPGLVVPQPVSFMSSLLFPALSARANRKSRARQAASSSLPRSSSPTTIRSSAPGRSRAYSPICFTSPSVSSSAAPRPIWRPLRILPLSPVTGSCSAVSAANSPSLELSRRHAATGNRRIRRSATCLWPKPSSRPAQERSDAHRAQPASAYRPAFTSPPSNGAAA